MTNRPLGAALLVLAHLALPVVVAMALVLRLVRPLAALAYLAAEDLALLAGGQVSVIGVLLGRRAPPRALHALGAGDAARAVVGFFRGS